MLPNHNYLLQLQNITCAPTEGHTIFEGVSMIINEGDIIALTGASGAGKTTLLKCMAHLNLYSGDIYYRGGTPQEFGVTSYRTKILYVPQRPSMLSSTPKAFLRQVQNYKSRKSSVGKVNADAAVELSDKWNVEADTWDRPWSSLSGGEAQRCALAVACSLPETEVLLLDEPTSALDAQTARLVEDHLLSLPSSASSNIKAIVWITHSDEQVKLATRWLHVENGLHERDVPTTA